MMSSTSRKLNSWLVEPLSAWISSNPLLFRDLSTDTWVAIDHVIVHAWCAEYPKRPMLVIEEVSKIRNSIQEIVKLTGTIGCTRERLLTFAEKLPQDELTVEENQDRITLTAAELEAKSILFRQEMSDQKWLSCHKTIHSLQESLKTILGYSHAIERLQANKVVDASSFAKVPCQGVVTSLDLVDAAPRTSLSVLTDAIQYLENESGVATATATRKRKRSKKSDSHPRIEWLTFTGPFLQVHDATKNRDTGKKHYRISCAGCKVSKPCNTIRVIENFTATKENKKKHACGLCFLPDPEPILPVIA